MDRQFLGVLKTTLQPRLRLERHPVRHLVSYFQIAYAAGMLLVGRLIDRFGTRAGYAAAMTFWSLASMAHAAAGSFVSFAAARFALGFRRSRRLPRQHQVRRRVVPQKGARLRHRHLQRRHQHRRHRHSAHRALDGFALGLALHLSFHGRAWIRLANLLAPPLPQTPRASARIPSRARLHPLRSIRIRRAKSNGPRSSRTANLHLRRRQISHRSHLVVLPFLDSRFLATPAWSRAHKNRRSIAVIYLISDVGSVAGGWLFVPPDSRRNHRQRRP